MVSEAREATPIVLEICTEDLLPCIDRCVILFKCMVGDASVDWLSVASAVIDVMTRLADIFFGPKLECVGITGSVIRAVTDVLHPREFHFLVCGARIRAIPNRISGKYVVKEVRGKVEIYDYQGRLVHGSQSVWVPNTNVWTFGKAAIDERVGIQLPVSFDVLGEETLLLFLVCFDEKCMEWPCSEEKERCVHPNKPALIIPPDLSSGVTTWQLIAVPKCFKYGDFPGNSECEVKGILQPDYKVKLIVSNKARGAKCELTLGELLGLCMRSYLTKSAQRTRTSRHRTGGVE